jgi:ADP-ribose pyrophosphatase YjhB (NUDIX family)
MTRPGEHEKAILALFKQEYSLSFSRIAQQLSKSAGLRSNVVAYHVKELVQAGKLEKDGAKYRIAANLQQRLSEKDERYAMPVVLVKVMRTYRGRRQVLLVRRTTRPFMGWLALPGSKLRFGESISACAQRVLCAHGIEEPGPLRVETIANEHLCQHGDERVKHHFLLLLVSAQGPSRARAHVKGVNARNEKGSAGVWRTLSNLDDVVPSDRHLIVHEKHIELRAIEDDDRLTVVRTSPI